MIDYPYVPFIKDLCCTLLTGPSESTVPVFSRLFHCEDFTLQSMHTSNNFPQTLDLTIFVSFKINMLALT